MSNISAGQIMRSKDIRPAPAEIEFKNMKFLITDRPTDSTIQNYIQELKKHNVLDVVRVCEPTYKISELKNEGINVTDLAFEDGTSPPQEIVEMWFELLKARFTESPGACVAVHCVAGLGRAPVLVALALIELGMKYEDAVDYIRKLPWLIRLYGSGRERPNGDRVFRVVLNILHRINSEKVALRGMFFMDRKRRGAINAKQLAYLEKYKPKSRLKLKNGQKSTSCVIQ